jgi:hypothetical protein
MGSRGISRSEREPESCGADPLVRAGPPGPACGTGINIRPDAKKPTRRSPEGTPADRGIRPTVKP